MEERVNIKQKLQEYDCEFKNLIITDMLDALASMWNQYCGENGHYHMSAGEYCCSHLQDFGLLDGEFGESKYPIFN